MDWTLLYRGEFSDLGRPTPREWQVDILRRATAADEEERPSVGVLTFETTPLVFEWDTSEKHECFAPCRCTLSLESPGDRTYTGLYSIEPGQIRINVYCAGKLFWAGLLDPEFYEEPFARYNHYAVKLTFTDFGIMRRRDFVGEGIVSVADVLRGALADAGLDDVPVNTSYISSVDSTTLKAIDLESICVMAANFYDEDGEAMTRRDTLEGVLAPLGLKIIQRGGAVYVYDLHGLYTTAPEKPIEWSSTNQTYGADKVANSVKITFSPYGSNTIIDGTIEHDGFLKNKTPMAFNVEAWWESGFGAVPVGFDICHGTAADAGEQPLTLSNGAQFFRIDAYHSGQNCAGVAWLYRGNTRNTYEQPALNSGVPVVGLGTLPSAFKPIITTRRAMVLGASAPGASDMRLRVSVNLLLDVRYNPFEAASLHNEEGDYDRLKNWANFGYIPCRLLLYDGDDNITHHYTNRPMVESNGSYDGAGACKWQTGPGSWGDMWLCWYDIDNRKSSTGFGGWATNKPCIGACTKALPTMNKYINSGDYLPLPPADGFIELQIAAGVYQFDEGDKRKHNDIESSMVRWMLYRDISVGYADKYFKEPANDDIEYFGYINAAAEDELRFDTVCGTIDTGLPGARGAYYVKNADGSYRPMGNISRGGSGDFTAERVLIGTLIGQYGERHDRLAGETDAVIGGPALRTDAALPGKKFMAISESYDVRAATSDLVLSQIVPDNYQPLITSV